MRVLHLPSNVGSQISILVRAQRAIGLDARGLVLQHHVMRSDEGIRAMAAIDPQMSPAQARLRMVSRMADLTSAVRWADVVHWHFNTRVIPRDLDLRLVAALGKARLVEFWGSDIRIPDIAARDNPYLAELLADPEAGYPISYQRSRATQERFARHGFACLAPGPELPDYIQPDLFPAPYRAEAALNLEDFIPRYPDPDRVQPVLVHAPTRLTIKGTAAVQGAIERLRARFACDFRLIHNVPRAEALAIMREGDILLDQFVIGSFGTAALEAMALGKPAVCFLKPSVVSNLPQDAPYVNANPDNLADVVGALLSDGALRREIGRRSRAYVELHHDAGAVARRLAAIYEELLERKPAGRGDRTAHERREAR